MKKKIMKKNFVKKEVFVLRMACLLFVCFLLLQPSQVQAATKASKAKAAYTELLKKPLKWGNAYLEPSNVTFGLIDINNDKVPELYVGSKKWNRYYDYKLYGYVSGKVKCLYSFETGSKLKKVYPATGTIWVSGSYNKGRCEDLLLKYNGKVLTKKVVKNSNTIYGEETYYSFKNNKNSQAINKAAYKKLVNSLKKGSAKNAPKLCTNTAAMRVKYLNATPDSKVLFEKGTLYAFTNGGFYLKISKISGRKLYYSIHMPYMDCDTSVADIKASGKTATSTVYCEDAEPHKLIFRVVNNGVRVTEITDCYDKLLASSSDDAYYSQIEQEFSDDNYYSDYSG